MPWLQKCEADGSRVKAGALKEGQDYVVRAHAESPIPDILFVKKGSGEISESMKFEGCTHLMLEAKHAQGWEEDRDGTRVRYRAFC